MMTEQPVSRGMFDMLAAQVAANALRLDTIDQGGTRGVGIVQVQLTDLAKDVAMLGTRLDKHEQEHELEARDRASVRWRLTGLVVTLFASIEAPLIALLLHR